MLFQSLIQTDKYLPSYPHAHKKGFAYVCVCVCVCCFQCLFVMIYVGVFWFFILRLNFAQLWCLIGWFLRLLIAVFILCVMYWWTEWSFHHCWLGVLSPPPFLHSVSLSLCLASWGLSFCLASWGLSLSCIMGTLSCIMGALSVLHHGDSLSHSVLLHGDSLSLSLSCIMGTLCLSFCLSSWGLSLSFCLASWGLSVLHHWDSLSVFSHGDSLSFCLASWGLSLSCIMRTLSLSLSLFLSCIMGTLSLSGIMGTLSVLHHGDSLCLAS